MAPQGALGSFRKISAPVLELITSLKSSVSALRIFLTTLFDKSGSLTL